MTSLQSHKELTVWQKSIDLAIDMYRITDKFPSEERFGLTSQLRRACVSIPSNIAEGRQRGSLRDYIRFLRIALGSTAEIETQICIIKRLQWSVAIDFSDEENLLVEITKMLKVMIRQLSLKLNSQ